MAAQLNGLVGSITELQIVALSLKIAIRSIFAYQASVRQIGFKQRSAGKQPHFIGNAFFDQLKVLTILAQIVAF